MSAKPRVTRKRREVSAEAHASEAPDAVSAASSVAFEPEPSVATGSEPAVPASESAPLAEGPSSHPTIATAGATPGSRPASSRRRGRNRVAEVTGSLGAPLAGITPSLAGDAPSLPGPSPAPAASSEATSAPEEPSPAPSHAAADSAPSVEPTTAAATAPCSNDGTTVVVTGTPSGSTSDPESSLGRSASERARARGDRPRKKKARGSAEGPLAPPTLDVSAPTLDVPAPTSAALVAGEAASAPENRTGAAEDSAAALSVAASTPATEPPPVDTPSPATTTSSDSTRTPNAAASASDGHALADGATSSPDGATSPGAPVPNDAPAAEATGVEATGVEATPADSAPAPVPLDPAAERLVMDAAVAAIEGVRPRNVEMQLEALLFSTNSPLTLDELSKTLGVTKEEVTAALRALERSLADRPTSIALWSRPKGGELGYILDVKTPFRRDVAALAPPALRGALVETLALIALNQPVPQRRLVAERGSTVYEHVKELVELGFVQKQRRGLNYLLRTTDAFAAEFGLPNQPDLIRQALAKAAGLARDPGAVTSDRVWLEGTAPADVQTSATEAAETAKAEEEARRAAEEAQRQAEEAQRQAEEKARAEELARVAEQERLRAADEAARVAALKAAEDARNAEAEAAARLALESARAPQEDCVVSGDQAFTGNREDADEGKLELEGSNGRRRRRNLAPEDEELLSDALDQLGGGSEVAW